MCLTTNRDVLSWLVIFGNIVLRCGIIFFFKKKGQNQVCPGKINHRVVKEFKITLPQFSNYLGGFSLNKRRLGDLGEDYYFKS